MKQSNELTNVNGKWYWGYQDTKMEPDIRVSGAMLGGTGRAPFLPADLSLWPFHGCSQTGWGVLWVGFVMNVKPRQGWTRGWCWGSLVPSSSADGLVEAQGGKESGQLTLPSTPFPNFRGSWVTMPAACREGDTLPGDGQWVWGSSWE